MGQAGPDSNLLSMREALVGELDEGTALSVLR